MKYRSILHGRVFVMHLLLEFTTYMYVEFQENFYGDSESQDVKSISGQEVKDGAQGQGQKRPPLTPKQEKQLKEIEVVGQYLKEIF